MLVPPPHFAGWKIRTIGDDIAWMKPGPDGRLYAINPEAGYFGVAPGTNCGNQPKRHGRHFPRHHLHQRGFDPRPGCLVGRQNQGAAAAIDRLEGRAVDARNPKTPAAHPNSRFAAPMTNNPVFAPEANDPQRRAHQRDHLWRPPRHHHAAGLIRPSTGSTAFIIGATMGSETTAAATGAVGQVRRDPMAMLPFCGYNMGHYFRHWLTMRKSSSIPPRIFHVNWFRRDDNGKFLWPGFGENMRVLKWIVDRCHGRADAREAALGWVPGPRDFDLEDMPEFDAAKLAKAQEINLEEWRRETLAADELFIKLYSDLPKELAFQRELLVARL